MTRVLSAPVAAAFVALAASGAAGISTGIDQASKPVRMAATPGYVLRVCRSSRLLASACPRRLPAVSHRPSEHPYEVFLCHSGAGACLGLRWDDLELQHVGAGDHPPLWTHLSIFAGRLATAFPFAYPRGGPTIKPKNGLFDRTRARTLFLGHVRWGRESGMLVLAPSYPSGGEQGDHLIFRWRRSSTDYAVGLHAWEPFLQVVATLKAIVASIPA